MRNGPFRTGISGLERVHFRLYITIFLMPVFYPCHAPGLTMSFQVPS
ncbi:hypothetical protein CLOBOL_00544 [Enterocloster bolteae ATCC BAA-613]|uniref:Uncharacterized protein n=1 Tax=Enterocloster bolteae (strain ATCC BAA-613 / DSM 15670 / CCUG 46953 / JCM 12243 / WAL 16351) TaxID=411902 RepID=A8RHY9_ENTBW|nr:hypothetical protein CLOBOL_00544 [Enterocloster bolteae ATCC BAA-613]